MATLYVVAPTQCNDINFITTYPPPFAEFLRWKATMLHAVAPKATLAIQKFVANLRPSGTMSMSNWIGLNIVILKSSAETMLVHLTFSYSLIEPIWFTGSIGSLDN